MRILAGRLRYQHSPPRHVRSAAGVAKTWLQGWGPERAQWLVPPSAVAALPLGSLGLVPQQAPLLQVLQARRRLQVLQVPQAQPDWWVGAFLAAWHRALARL
jgi:hypothetical protein